MRTVTLQLRWNVHSIFFSSDRRDPGCQIDLWGMNGDGTAPTLLTPFPGNKEDPVFFPAG